MGVAVNARDKHVGIIMKWNYLKVYDEKPHLLAVCQHGCV